MVVPFGRPENVIDSEAASNPATGGVKVEKLAPKVLFVLKDWAAPIK
jgi:hypothetical protein